jgi:hypothetical protein
MSIKSNNVKKFIADAGTKSQLFVFVGSDEASTSSNSTQSGIDVWRQSDFSVRVGQNSLSAVIPNVRWSRSNYYRPWSAVSVNTDNFYAYNSENGYVYLCVSNNAKNRKDVQDIVSTIRPTHTAGIVRYSDGYAWRPMYRVTSGLERFVSAQWIPVVSLDTFDSGDQKTQLQQAQDRCGVGFTTLTGNCAIYAKKALNTDNDEDTIEYQIGDLFTTAENITCSDCYYLMRNNENFVSVFYEDGDTIPTSITINDKFTEIGNLIANNQLTTSSPYWYLYQCNINDNLEEGSIVSVAIDLSAFTKKQLTVTTANPELTITSNTGSGGRIRLLTSILENNYVVDGIEIISVGSGYRDITVSLANGILSGASWIESVLVAAIDVNLDTIDGLGFDPVNVLGSQHVMIDARLKKQDIESAGILLPESVNFFGLVENPTGISTSTSVTTGSDLNKKLDYIFRTTVKATIQYTRGGLPETDEKYIITYTKGSTDKTITDGKVGGVSATSATTELVELKNILYSDADDMVDGELTSTSKDANITTIVSKPVFQQYTGSVLSTTKLTTNLPISDIDSVIIRINMVKGM